MTPIATVADIILILHFLWVLGILLPIPLIVLGARRGWRWVRNYAFRVAHLAMIGIVVLESLFGIVCPLTSWEDALRQKAAQTPYGQPFVSYWVSRLLYYEWPTWVFMLIYVAVGAIVIALFFLIPPERQPRRP